MTMGSSFRSIRPTMVTPDRLDRRSVIKGISLGAGATVLQPFLQGLAAEAAGQAAPPRIIFFIENNGLWTHHLRPKGPDSKGDQTIDLPLKDLELPEAIAALAPLKDRLTLLPGGISCVNAQPSHGASFGALGAFNPNVGSGKAPRRQTIDHAIAAANPSIIPVVGLGVSGSSGVFKDTVSASQPGRSMPMVLDPDVAFRLLFGSVAEGAAGQTFQARQDLVDYLRSDIRRVANALPAMDKQKLEVYLDTFEQMRKRQDKIDAIRADVRAATPSIETFKSSVQTERFEAQCAIAVAALASRLTNVVVLDASCGPHNYKTWKELGITTDGHAIGHMNPGADQEKLQVPIRQYHAKRVADLAQRLEAFKEGNGTLLDNTLIVWMSDAAESHHGTGLDWPMVLVGTMGGRLKQPGRWLEFPGYQKAGHKTLQSFYLALLHAVGDKRESFGEPDNDLKDMKIGGPLSEILA
jgi:hypothetical protein